MGEWACWRALIEGDGGKYNTGALQMHLLVRRRLEHVIKCKTSGISHDDLRLALDFAQTNRTPFPLLFPYQGADCAPKPTVQMRCCVQNMGNAYTGIRTSQRNFDRSF